MLNPVVISVCLMLLLSLLRVNVVLALSVSAMVGGLLSHMSLAETIASFEAGLGDGAQIALSYALLGAFAVAISRSGLTDLIANKIVSTVDKNRDKHLSRVKWLMLVAIILMAVSSQNLVPVHIAFIPILIPPLLAAFNQLNIDRRIIACCITFGLVTTYMWLPYGFGSIFLNQLLHSNIESAGLVIERSQLPKAMTIPAIGMIVGLLTAIFVSYRKPRQYKTVELIPTESETQTSVPVSKGRLIMNVVIILLALAINVYTESIIIGALCGFLMLTTAAGLRPQSSQDLFVEGVKLMALIGFIMIAANGFAGVMKATGGVPELVANAGQILGSNKMFAAAVLLIMGLLITMGIGSSFSTIPIIAAIYVPLALSLGFSDLATVALVGTAAALGDAGSPASDSTLGPTAGLNSDGQHDHIWDTVVPTFLHFNLPLLVFGWIAAIVL
ncbi:MULTISPECIES: Na+/H+ antiporter family protein [unclassified Agarivorans]|uniref:Na+/H+ antiporter family protein n=1 Tax=unclassified Agarivorans TaxID=2636026 RepID=UPI0026E41632|nr:MULTISPECIES: Na+/H+ antiporter NhaC family protein [unclassified Agarivorans]MDO6688098.1 Na+/H+ antiporter NhaC family protein [Agarivorans sp. 3_MG-2023]MDO6717699.1 Na+/H+ antiporter NhaC family protein [Agarivorans sp. 2_MG-2023]MDO6766151.1 Na+/H+ antiporter NhaC family protein [Agarivorans sp. 1_MG-2023]